MKPVITLLGFAAMLAMSSAHAHVPTPNQGVTVEPKFGAPIPNIPGKSLKSVIVTYAPGGTSSAHRHAASAYIYAQVLEGEIRSQVEGEPAHIFKVGDVWTENPGAHHAVSENASKTKTARLLAVFVVDTDETVLTTPDQP